MPAARHDKQLRLLTLMREREGASITIDDICKATGWKLSAATTYLGKGLVGGVLFKQPDKSYLVQGAAALTEAEFLRLTSQSKQRQEFGHQFSNPIVRQLLERSRTNVGLAIEIFNRASLENRLDAFVLLFITGWEQLLKAELEHKESRSIFTGEKTRTGRDKTIGFQACLDRLFATQDVVRRNLEMIRSLRDDAAHLLVVELQPIAVRYFQSGLVNYTTRFQDFAGEPAIKVVGTGLLTLAMPYSKPDIVALRRRYGDATTEEVVALVDILEREAAEASDMRFAVNVKYQLVLTDEPGASAIHLTNRPDGTTGLIVEKAVDAERRYCYFAEELKKALTVRTGHSWTRAQVMAAIHVEKVKKADNQHHHHFKKTNRHAYSADFVELLVKRLLESNDYLQRAKESHSASQQRARRK